MGADGRGTNEQYCAAAEAWLAKGSPRRALRSAGLAIAADADSNRARRLRARALLDLGQPKTALLDLVAVAATQPDTPAPWYDVLAVAQRAGDRSLVERALTALDATDATTVEALLDAADAAYLDGDLDAARTHLSRAAGLHPAHPELAGWTERLCCERSARDLDVELAAALIRRDRPSDALARLERAGDESPRGAHLRGRALLRLGRFDEAIGALECARASAPGDDEIALELATAAHFAGESGRAIGVCDEILGRDPTLAAAALLAAEARLAADDLDGARRLVCRALAAAPSDPAAWYTQAGVLDATGDANGARTAADHSIALDPDVAAAWQRGADVLQGLARNELAEWYRAAAAARGGPGRRVDRAELPPLSRDDIATEDAVARSADPATPFVVRDRFRIACELHAHDLAEALGERLAGTDADDDGAVSTVLGFIALERGDLDAARASFRSALDANPGDDEASGGLAVVAAMAGARPAAPPAADPEVSPPPAAATPSARAAPRQSRSAKPSAPAAPKRPAQPGQRRRRAVGIARRVFVLVWMAVGFTTSALVLYNLLQDDQAQQSQPLAAEEAAPPTAAPAPTPAPTVPPTAPLTASPTVPVTASPTVPVTAPPTNPVTVPPTGPVTAPPTTFDEFVPQFFATPEEALADWLAFVEPPYAGTCDSLSDQTELAGVVTCSVFDHEVGVAAQVFRWGVFATDDLRGWVLVDVGSAGWSVADETFELTPPW
jgi:tetratricopeptide (TPR) repeat protein